MDLIIYILLIFTVIIMIVSVKQLFTLHQIPFPVFSWSHFCVLLFAYIILIFGFTLIYLGLLILDIQSVGFSGISLQDKYSHLLGNIMYFSAMTMLTVGYGDLTPTGLGKLVASIQALIGYLLPTAFFISGIMSVKNRSTSRLFDKN